MLPFSPKLFEHIFCYFPYLTSLKIRLNFSKIERKLIELILADNNLSDVEMADKLNITEQDVCKIRNKLGNYLIKYIKNKNRKIF